MPQLHELRDHSDFDALLAASRRQPVVLLKHSIACSLSERGRRQVAGLDSADDPPLYTVVVQYARDLSDHIAATLGVRHETPQALLIRDGEVVYHASHFAVSTEALRDAAARTAV